MKAVIQRFLAKRHWIPAFAGMTNEGFPVAGASLSARSIHALTRHHLPIMSNDAEPPDTLLQMGPLSAVTASGSGCIDVTVAWQPGEMPQFGMEPFA
jgi:hypothetical protein